MPADAPDFVCPHGKEWGDDPPPPEPPPTEGPGTELKRLLAKMGIHASPNCACNAMADRMNREGGKWCLENIDIIVDVMRGEAAKRGLPFVSAIARAMVRRCARR